ncbi:MAG: aspartate aminotransferase, partial [Bacteroidetes bacterium]|nr:aspartate aminotransferase [Bacteroidota bacterium]
GDKEVNNANDFCLYILENANVSLVLGDAFGDPNCIRLSYAASEEDLKKALTSIKEVLARLK